MADSQGGHSFRSLDSCIELEIKPAACELTLDVSILLWFDVEYNHVVAAHVDDRAVVDCEHSRIHVRLDTVYLSRTRMWGKIALLTFGSMRLHQSGQLEASGHGCTGHLPALEPCSPYWCSHLGHPSTRWFGSCEGLPIASCWPKMCHELHLSVVAVFRLPPPLLFLNSNYLSLWLTFAE